MRCSTKEQPVKLVLLDPREKLAMSETRDLRGLQAIPVLAERLAQLEAKVSQDLLARLGLQALAERVVQLEAKVSQELVAHRAKPVELVQPDQAEQSVLREVQARLESLAQSAQLDLWVRWVPPELRAQQVSPDLPAHKVSLELVHKELREVLVLLDQLVIPAP